MHHKSLDRKKWISTFCLIKGRKYLFLGFLFFIFGSIVTTAQNSSLPNEFFHYKAETRASFAGGENTPFWLVSNLHGLGSPYFNNGYVRGEIHKNIESDNKFSWGAGVDLVGAWNQEAPFRIQQLYAELKYRHLWVSIGSREFTPLYNDPALSSGDLLFSGNAMPIPQVRVGTYGFAPFWGCKGWFSVNAYLAYGMFTDSNWKEHWVAPATNNSLNVLFCSRAIWFRFGNIEKFPLTFDFGCEMGTQFGGTIYHENTIIKMPTGFMDWIRAFIPDAGGKKTPWGEQLNIQGNMTGEYTFSLIYNPTKDWKLRAYFEHYFEDYSQMFFQYGPWKDGLWGVEIEFPHNPFVSKFVYEFINTTDQTGAVLNYATPEIPEQVSGRDGYYTHYLYGAWQNWGMSMGTPLAISPIYNRSHLLTLYNTRFVANHCGLEGQPLRCLSWRLLLTHTRNRGTYYRPLSEIMDNFSGLVQIDYKPSFVNGLFIKGSLAWDHGPLLGNNFGGMISVGFEGDFSLKTHH